MALSADRRELRARAIATVVFLAASIVTLLGVRDMSGGMPMPGGWMMSMMWMAMPGQSVWGAAWMFLVMWQAMMIAMMLPSSWPMLELYRRVAHSNEMKHPGLATALVGVGYFAIWLAFGVAVFAIGQLISQAAMRSEGVSRLMPAAAGVGLVIAGAYQLSRWKRLCLNHCSSPLSCLSSHFRPGMSGALRLGVLHGIWCAGCCWALMLMQIVLGIMNLGVMVLIAAVIAVEKLWKGGPMLARVAGGLAFGTGLGFLYFALVP